MTTKIVQRLSTPPTGATQATIIDSGWCHGTPPATLKVLDHLLGKSP